MAKKLQKYEKKTTKTRQTRDKHAMKKITK